MMMMQLQKTMRFPPDRPQETFKQLKIITMTKTIITRMMMMMEKQMMQMTMRPPPDGPQETLVC